MTSLVDPEPPPLGPITPKPLIRLLICAFARIRNEKRACIRRPTSPYRPLISSGELPPALARARYQALAAIRSTKRRIGLDVVETAPLGLRTRTPRPGPPPVRRFLSPARIGSMPGRLAAPARRWCYRPLCIDAVVSLPDGASTAKRTSSWVISTPAPAANRHAAAETAPHHGVPLGTGDNPGSAETTAPLAPGAGATALPVDDPARFER